MHWLLDFPEETAGGCINVLEKHEMGCDPVIYPFYAPKGTLGGI